MKFMLGKIIKKNSAKRIKTFKRILAYVMSFSQSLFLETYCCHQTIWTKTDI